MTALPFLIGLFLISPDIFAASKISRSFQGSFGSSLSSGPHRIRASGPHLAASVFLSGVHAVQGGFLAFLKKKPATTVIQPGQDIVRTVNGPAGPITLVIPAGSLPAGTLVTLQLPVSATASATGGLRDLPQDIAAEIISTAQPSKPAFLTFSYVNANVDGANPEQFIVARYSDENGVWTPQESAVNAAGKTVTGTLTHFSVFKMLQSAPAQSLGGVKVFPNPLRPSRPGHVRFTFTGLPQAARLKVYTILGELLAELDADSAGMSFWGARNKSGKKVASGVYLVHVKSDKGSKVVKIAVER